MASPWYTPGGNPATASALSSATMRTELGLIETALDQLPAFSGNAGEVLRVNSGETAIEASTTLTLTSDFTALTITATGDTSAGDNATIGYTAAEGLILTGQGSTNDITMKNDADVTVMSVATGGTAVVFVGTITAATASVIGNLTLGDGSIVDSSGAISFGNENLSTTGTLASGALTVTGLITGGDLTLNAANPEILGGDTDGIMYIAPSTTNALGGLIRLYGDTHGSQARDIEFFGTTTLQLRYDDSGSLWDFQANAVTTTGVITGLTLEATGDTSSSDNAAMGYTSAEGLILTGQGSSEDVTIKNANDVTVISIPTGTNDVTFADDLLLPSGAVLNFDSGDVTITHSSNTLTIAGGITVLASGSTVANFTFTAGSITDSGGAISFGNENLSTTGTLASGALTVTGLLTCGDITLNAANPEILGGDTDGIMYIAPSTTNALGGLIRLYGDTHSTQARDIEFYGTTTLQLLYDDSGSLWDFQANAITTTGVITGPSGSWTSSGINIATTDSYFIDSNNVLSQTVLGSTVLASSLTSLGTIASLVATTADINAGTVDATIGGTTPAAGTFTAIIGTTITGSGILSIDDTTASTSATTGSIHTDGGLGVVLNTFLGGTLDVAGNTIIGSNTVAPDGTLHIHTATAGSIAAHADGNELVIENSGQTGATLLAPDASESAWYHGSPSNNRGALARWRYSTLAYTLGSNTVGGSTVLSADQLVANLTLSGASGSEIALFADNVGLGTTSFGTSAAAVLGIAIGTEPTTEIAGQIVIYAKDSSAGSADATLALNVETDPIAIGTFTPSHKIPIWINQVEYHIQLDAV